MTRTQKFQSTKIIEGVTLDKQDPQRYNAGMKTPPDPKLYVYESRGRGVDKRWRKRRKRAAYQKKWRARQVAPTFSPGPYPPMKLRQVANSAKKRGLPFSLTPADAMISACCPVLGTAFDWNDKNRKPSIDRIDNNKGYIPGNIRVISLRANRLKSDATLEEVIKIASYMESSASGSQVPNLPRTATAPAQAGLTTFRLSAAAEVPAP